MNDVNLLAFGCGVSFIVIAGMYVYLRECWEGQKEPAEARDRKVEVLREDARDVA